MELQEKKVSGLEQEEFSGNEIRETGETLPQKSRLFISTGTTWLAPGFEHGTTN